MNKYFECKIRYEKQITDPESKDCGKIKRVNETYLVDALSYTEAEARMAEEAAMMIRGDYTITGIKQARIAEIVLKEDDEFESWYNSKVKLIIIDESKGVEKKVTQNYLVRARSVEECYNRIKEYNKELMSDYEISAISQSPIMEYFRYKVDNTKETQEV